MALNRCKEIIELNNPKYWNEAFGSYNATDVTSRGCGGKDLVDSKWYEDPDWLGQMIDCSTYRSFLIDLDFLLMYRLFWKFRIANTSSSPRSTPKTVKHTHFCNKNFEMGGKQKVFTNTKYADTKFHDNRNRETDRKFWTLKTKQTLRSGNYFRTVSMVCSTWIAWIEKKGNWSTF